MSYVASEWIEDQRRRFMRPDAQRYWRADADRLVSRETLKALGWQDPYATQQPLDAEPDFKSEAGLLEYRRELEKLRLDWELFKLSLKAQKAGFDPAQPRDDRGRWTGNGTVDVQSIVSRASRLSAVGGRLSYQRCLDLCYPLLERSKPPGSDRNKWDFHKCMNACLGRK